MSEFTGAGSAIGVANEETWGTLVSPAVWHPLHSTTMVVTPGFASRSHLVVGSSGARIGRAKTGIEVGGTVVVPLQYRGMGILLKNLVGGSWGTTGTGPYTHTRAAAAAVPTGFSVTQLRGDGTQEELRGCLVSRGVVRLSSTEPATLSLDLIAKQANAREALSSPSWTTSRDLIVDPGQVSVCTWNSTSWTPSSIEITVDNRLARRRNVTSLYTAKPTRSDKRQFMVRMDLDAESDALYTAYLAGTSGDLVITTTDGTDSITFTVHNAQIESYADPINGFGIVRQSVTFEGSADASDAGLALSLYNGQSDAEAA